MMAAERALSTPEPSSLMLLGTGLVRSGIRCVPEGQDVRPGLAVVVIFPLLPEGAGLALSGGQSRTSSRTIPLAHQSVPNRAYLALLRPGRKVVTLQHLLPSACQDFHLAIGTASAEKKIFLGE